MARAAGVHRSLIHRHGDLHAAVTARANEPLSRAVAGTQVSRTSLLTDVANLTARNKRLAAHITRLERRLSEALGQAVWEASGLGAPADTDTLTRRTTELEQQILDLRSELAERDEDPPSRPRHKPRADDPTQPLTAPKLGTSAKRLRPTNPNVTRSRHGRSRPCCGSCL
ncbi:hypothetical protein ACU686_12595 [Yinghuangia aomiensis]